MQYGTLLITPLVVEGGPTMRRLVVCTIMAITLFLLAASPVLADSVGPG